MLHEQWQRNLAGILVAVFVSILGFNLVFPFLPLYIQTLGSYDAGAAAFWTGILGLVSGIVGAIAALIWGQLADRRGRRPMIIRATAGSALGLVVMGLALNIVHLLIGRVMFSALAGTVPASNPLIAANTPAEHLSSAMGMLQGASYLSNTLGPVVGGALAYSVGYRATFFVTALLYIAAAVPVVLLVREQFVPPPATRGFVQGITGDFGHVMRSAPILLPILVGLLALTGQNIIYPIVPLVVRDMVGAGRAEVLSGVAFAVQGLASAASAVLVGRFLTLLGIRSLLKVTEAAALVAFVALWFVPAYWMFTALLGVIGMARGAQIPTINALIAARSPRDRVGAVFGVVSSINTIAFSGGPFVGGVLASALGLRAVFPAAALTAITMIMLVGRATAPAPGERAAAPVGAADDPAGRP
jgi:DHA1 family multidrug resistance protein-like MFS transporter